MVNIFLNKFDLDYFEANYRFTHIFVILNTIVFFARDGEVSFSVKEPEIKVCRRFIINTVNIFYNTVGNNDFIIWYINPSFLLVM